MGRLADRAFTGQRKSIRSDPLTHAIPMHTAGPQNGFRQAALSRCRIPVSSVHRPAVMLADEGVPVPGRRGYLDFQPTTNRADVRG